jgi:sec-independent protein translocase protein TatB
VFENLGGFEILALMLIALFIIGPDRLPKAISDTMGFLRKVRSMARNATSDLSRELGTNIELEDLHPKTFLRKHLLTEAEEESLRKPFQEAFRDLKSTTDDAMREVKSTADAINLDKGKSETAAGTTRSVTGATVGSEPASKPALKFDDAT